MFLRLNKRTRYCELAIPFAVVDNIAYQLYCQYEKHMRHVYRAAVCVLKVSPTSVKFSFVDSDDWRAVFAAECKYDCVDCIVIAFSLTDSSRNCLAMHGFYKPESVNDPQLPF